MAESAPPRAGVRGILMRYLKSLGPGFISGASDDDPCGLGTYAQTGALFGYTQLWTALFTFPMMLVVQEMVARIALQTGCGLAEVIRRHYARPVLYGCIFLFTIINTINIGADLGAMAASARLLIRWPFLLWLLGISVLTVVLAVSLNYRRYARLLQLLALSLFAYVIVLFVVPQDWGQMLRSTLLPTVELSRTYLLNLVAVLGTTISPYLFFWEADQEVEEMFGQGKCGVPEHAGVTRGDVRWMRTDVTTGMFLSNFFMWAVIATTASTLHRHGVTHIDSAVTAAQALRPLAGDFAGLLFAAGIVGTGLLAVPVMAGATAYALAETFKWRRGLNLHLRQAPGFYGVIALSTLLGAAMNLLGINPILALYYTAILSGFIVPPLLVIIMLVSSNRRIMGAQANRPISNIVGWITTLVTGISALALLWDWVWGK